MPPALNSVDRETTSLATTGVIPTERKSASKGGRVAPAKQVGNAYYHCLSFIYKKIFTNIYHIPPVIYRVAIVQHAINLAAYKRCPSCFSNKRDIPVL